MAERTPLIGLDVGGSSVKHGLVDPNQPLDFTVQSTPINSRGTADEIISTLADVIASHLASAPQVSRIGFGFPGPFDYKSGVSWITGLEKYEAVYGLNIGEILRTRLGKSELNFRFRNDAEAAIVGEANFGAGQSCSRIIGLTLGTGFGSAFTIDGRVVTSGEGVPTDGWLYPLVVSDERADDVFSTRGLLKRFAAAGILLDRIRAADESTDEVRAVYADFGAHLGAFLRPFVQEFRADCVLVMGGIARAMPLFQTAMEAALPQTHIEYGKLGQRAAILGAVREWI